MIPSGRLLTKARGSLVRDEIWQIFLDLQETDKSGGFEVSENYEIFAGTVVLRLGRIKSDNHCAIAFMLTENQ